MINHLRLLFGSMTILLLSYSTSFACSPCSPMTALQSSITGNTLTLNFNSNAGWNCCYTAGIEIICAGGSFTGVPNYFSVEICHTGGQNTNIPYPAVDIDISGFCPGVYEWRVSECTNVYSAVASFVVPGTIVPIVTSVSPLNDTICVGESVQLTASATGGCNTSFTYSWSPSSTLSNSTIADPIATPVSTTTYTVSITEVNFCNLPATQLSVEIVVVPPPTLTTSSVTDTCSVGVGTVSVVASSGSPPYTYSWPALGSSSPNVSNVPAGPYVVQVVDDEGCDASASVVVDNFEPVYATDSTVVSCEGGSDGTATVVILNQVGNLTYLWDDPNAQTTQTATGLSAGVYNCVVTSDYGCTDNVTVTVTENLQLLGSVVNLVNVSCNSGSDGSIEVFASQGTPAYTYSWTGSSSVTELADNLSAGSYTCTITDDLGCTIDVSATITEPDPLDITFITPTTDICPEDSILLQATGTGGSSPYTFTWYENGNLLDVGNPIWADHNSTNTEYCVVLSEACGSPTDEECTIINFHPAIVPNANPVEICVDGLVQFTNLSSLPGDIVTTYWDFGYGQTSNTTAVGTDPVFFSYPEVGYYDIIMTVSSVHGCVYTDTFINHVNVYGNPTAYFTITENPTLVTNTSVTAADASSHNAIYREWTSPFSNPSSGNDEIMHFDFPHEAGVYPIGLYIETEEGCSDSIVLNLTVYEQAFFAPNSFTPDGDEFNQVWKPEFTGYDVYDYHLLIFNRWGQVIFESYDPEVGWDGTFNGSIAQTGTYTWKVETKKLYEDDRVMFNGSINLLK